MHNKPLNYSYCNMATNDLRQQIIDLFYHHPEDNVGLLEICTALRQPKKTVNSILYRLKKENILHKVVESPPVWRLLNCSRGQTDEYFNNNASSNRRLSSFKVAGSYTDSIKFLENRIEAFTLSPKESIDPEIAKVSSDADSNNFHSAATFELSYKEYVADKHIHQGLREMPDRNIQLTEPAMSILQVFQEHSGPLTVKTVSNKIGCTESVTNVLLYQLLQKGLVKRIEGSPSLWTSSGVNESTANGIFTDIINYLQMCGTAVPALMLAKIMGFQSKKEINPILYHLEKQGILKKVNDTPPLWQLAALVDTNKNISENFSDEILNKSYGVLEYKTYSVNESLTELKKEDQETQSGNLIEDIEKVLVQSVTSTTNEISAALGIHNTKRVEDALVYMQRKNIVQKLSDNPSKWSLQQQQHVQLPHEKTVPLPVQEGSRSYRCLNDIDKEHKDSKVSYVEANSSFSSHIDCATLSTSKPASDHSSSKSSQPLNGTHIQNSTNKHNKSANNHSEQKLYDSSLSYQNDASNLHTLPSNSKKNKADSVKESSDAGTQPYFTSNKCESNSSAVASLPTSSKSYSLNRNHSQENTPKSESSNVHNVQKNFDVNSPVHYINDVLNSTSFAALMKNPVSALYEYGQRNHVATKVEILSTEGPPHNPRFRAVAFMGNDELATAWDKTKKDAKRQAAELAVRQLVAKGNFGKWNNLAPTVDSLTELSPVISQFDMIAAICHKTFNERVLQVPEYMGGRKVLAALVMKKGANDRGVVICFGTGNRCISGEGMSQDGLVVNDSHAEVITRRGFLRFLYKQLKCYNPDKEHPVLEPSDDGDLLKICDDITFHLYISTAPCGDGALFTHNVKPGEQVEPPDTSDGKHHPVFTKSLQGLLRSKMEAGEGTIPIDTQYTFQSWDAILRGEKLRTMSCSDKIARWNVLGLQGALIGLFIKPIYLSSITLGNLYHHGHFSRAVCCRLEGEPPLNELLPSDYKLNHPDLGRVNICTPARETEKTKPHSINWSLEDERPELISGVSGTCDERSGGQSQSRLCKASLYQSFKEVCRIHQREDLLSKAYGKTKLGANDFQIAKGVLFDRFRQLGRGIWIRKPPEEEEFI